VEAGCLWWGGGSSGNQMMVLPTAPTGNMIAHTTRIAFRGLSCPQIFLEIVKIMFYDIVLLFYLS
jgi:hypothetical protein